MIADFAYETAAWDAVASDVAGVRRLAAENAV